MEQRWNTVFEDQRLSATDKACYALVAMRADATGEYRFGVNYLAKHMGIKWETANQALRRLTETGYLGPINPGTSRMTWRVIHTVNPSISPGEGYARRENFSPQEAPRMGMPPNLASTLLRLALDRKRELDAAITSDMPAVTDALRLQWQAESDRIDEAMDTLTRWLARFGGGIPVDLQQELDS